MGPPLEVIRYQMISAIQAGRKQVGELPEHPPVWQPTSIPDPRIGICFTTRTCWPFIEQLLQSNFPFSHTVLRKPRGKDGYEFVVDVLAATPLYIKLAFNGHHVIGRSFHWDTKLKTPPTRPTFLYRGNL